MNRGAEGSDNESGADLDTASRASGYRTSYTRTRRGVDDGAIFVSNIFPDKTQEELSEALAPFGKYERSVTREFLAFLTPLEQLGFLNGLHHRP